MMEGREQTRMEFDLFFIDLSSKKKNYFFLVFFHTCIIVKNDKYKK